MDVREAQHEAACLPLERLEAEITTLAGHLAAAECRWLLMVAEFDRRKGYEQWGCWCASQWLGWKCGLAERAAKKKVRVARALDDLPAITEAFAKGELSYSQVRALTRVAEAATETDLLMIASHATAAQLERLVRSYRGVLRRADETAAANRRHDRRYVSSPGTTTARSSSRPASTLRKGRWCWPRSMPRPGVPRNILTSIPSRALRIDPRRRAAPMLWWPWPSVPSTVPPQLAAETATRS